MEHVSILDRKYAAEPVPCPNEGSQTKLPQSNHVSSVHGNMQVHGSGSYLVCGLCDMKIAIGRV